MSQERYHQIEALAEAALKLEGSQRQDFLQRACGSDQDLLQRVNALVEGYEASNDFLERPALETWARDAATESAVQSLAGRDLGRFLVLKKLGAGGIGEVWLAKDKELSRDVALKFLSPELAGGSDQARRFQQEARAASALNHPNLVTIFDIGEFEGRQFIAQEYVPGKTVREVLSSDSLSAEAVVDIATQIAAGLRAAHAAGVVHRDVKPENIMVRPDGVVKILDFGIARFRQDRAGINQKSATELTRPGLILGTARYMSPEQARGLPLDGRSDIFSFGVVLYEIFSGSAPFTGATPSDVLAAILNYEPPPLSRKARHVPAEFERIVQRCLAKDPAARYAAAALHEDCKSVAAKLRRTSLPLATWIYAAIAVLTVAAMAIGLILNTQRKSAPQFGSMKIMRLPTRGEVSDVTIARDGKELACIIDEGDKHSIWIREVSGSNERVAVASDDGELSGIMFSPDDSYLYYRSRGSDGIGNLFRVPAKGGPVERVISDVSGAAALSSDGKRVAFIRLKPSTWEASLVVSNSDGSSEFAVETVRRPQFLDERAVAWRPDGQAIAYFAGESAPEPDVAFHLVEVNLRHPGQRLITPQLWKPLGLAWAAKGDVLIVTAATPGDLQQLWTVRYGTGEVTRLTNDLSNYGRVSITDDGDSIVAVQSVSFVSIWAATSSDNSRFTRIATSIPSPRTAVGWTHGGGVIYNDPADGFRDIWSMDADGANPKRLTSSAFNKDELVVTRDGRYIVYQQDPNIWRVKRDGTEPTQLTHGRLDVHPDISPDGKNVVYASFADWVPGIGGEPTLWRVSIDGGEATQISQQPASIPSVSPDGKQIACIHFPGKDPRISSALLAVTSVDGRGRFTLFQRSPAAGTTLSWSPDGQALDFVLNTDGVGNLWRQPLAGGSPVQVTHFDRDDLIHFAWSPEGRLLCTRGKPTHSAILIQNFH
jgi:serine/threonine protein kinase